MAANPEFVTTPNNQYADIADPGTAGTTIWSTVAEKGGLVRAINVCHQDEDSGVGNVSVRLYVVRGADSVLLCTVAIPQAAGYLADGSVPPVNLVDPQYIQGVDHEPNRALILGANDSLVLDVVSPGLTLDHRLSVAVFGGDY